MTSPRLLRLGLASALAWLGAARLAADVLTLAPTADTYIRSDTPDTAQGTNALLLVGDTASAGSAMRALLGFDLGAELPAGAVVRGASLRLLAESADENSGANEETLQVFALAENFTGAATWRQRHSAASWATPGALKPAGEPLAVIPANPAWAKTGQAIVFESGALLAAARAQSAGRLDLLVKLAREDATRGVFRLGSSRAKGREPSLVIEYDLPGNAAGVTPIPGHPGRPPSEHYALVAGGRPVEVRAERFGFDVALLETPPEGAEVTVTLAKDFSDFSLKPARHAIAVKRDGRALTFRLDAPRKLVLQVDALPPLAIIATPPEVAPPHRDDPSVLYFPPGVTVAGVIRPESGQTIYLAPGALVKGRIEAKNVRDVTVRGRGILETTGYSKREDKTHGILFEHSRRIRVEGIGVRSYHTWWQTLFLNSRDIEVAHLNIFGVGVNTDGVDIDGVRDFLVRDTFIRAEDDGLGWHALDAQANGEPVTERARATDLVIWNTGAGNGIRIGASMETQLWRDIVIEKTDILMHKENGIYSDYSDWAWTEDLVFRDVVIEKPSRPITFKVVKTHYSNATGFLDERGHLERLVFERVRMNGGAITLEGADAGHRIDQVWFNDCVNAGAPVASSADIRTNAHVTGVTFDAPVPPRPAPPSGRHEAEALESSTNERPQVTYADADASGGKARVLRAITAGDWVEYVVEAQSAGRHRLAAGVVRRPESGRVAVSVNGAPLGAERDLGAANKRVERVELGEVVFNAAGEQRVRFTLAGQAGGRDGLRFDLDYLDVTPMK